MTVFNCPTCDQIPDIHAHFEERAESFSGYLKALACRSERELIIQAIVRAGLCLCPALQAHHTKEASLA